MEFITAYNNTLAGAGVQFIIGQAFGVRPIWVNCTKKQLAEALQNAPEAVAVIDYDAMDNVGVDYICILKQRFPKAYILIISHTANAELIKRFSNDEYVGFASAGDTSEEIAEALRNGIARHKFISLNIKTNLEERAHTASMSATLTATEQEVLRLVALGKSVKEIAAARSSSVGTIITHKKNIFRKLGVSNVYEASRYALRAGIAEPIEYYI